MRSNSVGRSVILRLFLFLAISIVSVYLFQSRVNADQLSWTNEPPTYSDSGSSVPTSELDAKNCINQQVFVSPDTQPTQICVYQKDNFRYGYYQKYHNPGMWNAYTENKLVVGIGSDSKMYKVENVSYSPMPLDLPIGDDLFYGFGCAGCPWGGDLYIYQDFIRNLHREFSFTAGTTYTYDDSKIKILRYPDNNQPLRVNRVGASDNGQWLVMEVIGRGIVRLDRQTMDMKQISGYTGRYGVGLDPRMEMAISDDGSHIAIAGSNTSFIAYDVDSECGGIVDSTMGSEMSNPCPSRQLNAIVDQQYPNGYFSIHKPAFDSEGGELAFYIKEQQTSQSVKGARVVAANYQTKQLDYLALGDSYSSGEGDTATTDDGQKYYLANTDVDGDYANGIPREKCHQSTRAYPFLLADHYNIPVADKFETVACSGAQIEDISAIGKYEGQARGGGSDGGEARLAELSNKSQLQSDALEEFIPGRIRQLHFIKEYKPEVITIGVGGNDAGFGGKINSCVNPGSSQRTCEWAESKKASLGMQIKGEFDDLEALYIKLRTQVSPETKIYTIGYPQFITDIEPAACGWNTGAVSKEEREMIVRATDYMNDVIEAASKKAGVQYIDITNALQGGKLCEDGQEFVTGISNFGSQESYHPNSHGNWKIAQKLKQFFGSSMKNYSGYPVDGDNSVVAPDSLYFSEAEGDGIKKSKNVQMSNEVNSKNNQQSQKIKPFTLKPNSTIKRELHSDPVDLGEVIVNEDGSLDTTFTIPNSTPVGYHTLIITGESYSGEPIELTQTILVTSDNPNDLDENGITDIDQPCGAFLEAVNVDEDFDNIDDACDPEISEANPYRVRNGDSQKNENPDYIYIERNVSVSTVTGISGDYDPDSDGWAIVAQSTKPQNAGVPAHFWIDDSKIPHVSIRSGDRGCVQFTPRTLKVVAPNKLRKLKTEAKNTNTCRSDPASDDIDNDGIPDNQQTLYRARNGDISNNEDPDTIYLERNSTSAEAQLGFSDYLHSNPWNLLATSHNDATKANFVKLVMVTNEEDTRVPTILALHTKTNNKGKTIITCIALQPQNTNVITINNQDRKLKKVNIPEGEGCE